MEQMILPICVFGWYSVTGEIEAYDGTSTVNITISLYILLQRQGKRFANANHILHTALVSFSSSPGL